MSRARIANWFGRAACLIEGRHPLAEWDAWSCPRCGQAVEPETVR